MEQLNEDTVLVTVEITPTVPHCSLATIIGMYSVYQSFSIIMCIRVLLVCIVYIRVLLLSIVYIRVLLVCIVYIRILLLFLFQSGSLSWRG